MPKNKIMIVEDEGLTAAYIQDILESVGYVVVAHEFSGEDAIESAMTTEPDLILMDIRLQGRMDGIEAAGEIQKRMSVPIVYLTAHSDKAILDRARITQPYGYVLKPFNSKELHSNIEMALYKHRTEKDLHVSAFYDTLTGLPNRSLFFDRFEQALKQAKRSQQSMALMMIDINAFASINETMGHEVGDQLLVDVASRLRDCIRESDTVARLGDDEFIIMLTGIKDPNDACDVATKIILSVGKPFYINSTNCSLGVSIGISIYPADGDSLKTLLKEADTAMYRAKECGKNRYRFFNETCEMINKDIGFLLDKLVSFVIARKGVWDQDGWVDLLIDIKRRGVPFSTDITRYVGALLESLKKLYVSALPVDANVDKIIPILSHEILDFILEHDGVWKQGDWEALLANVQTHGLEMSDDLYNVLRDSLESLNALYVLLCKKCSYNSRD
ncbi:diguanylate cyclase domain-containing protein [Candidatus Magnetominusculus xianensis]|uniref:Diguanylate cyclase n=1 Tax=Candidatus Magnetominusculus xianensis TaxID=1748249 RepID=A0ABR5SHS1_9BACT|nr:diguanylate cyclase [Candidatus Magnetominusculus xianensis]KWT86734.1 diguanylate cyclase [Candidatus Magnetominusculus xianensis]MBF0402547.1 diguanylate cyclase [Nitrospirota bacterium]